MSEANLCTGGRWWRGDAAALACIVLLGALIYGHTLNVPWYLDDNRGILENEAVLRIGEALSEFFSGRGLANLTFALNYRLGGTDVTWYHVVNISIHLATSCIVFLLLKRVFRDRRLLALGGALIFVAHPLQTQAVTYIVQRMTSMAGLFFFLALYLYVLARESDHDPSQKSTARHWLFYAAALLSGALAVLTKQNAAVLPVALLLFDRYFMPRGRLQDWRRQLWYLAPFFLVPVLLAVKSLLLPIFSGAGLDNVGGMPDLAHLKNNSPLNYLVTQFSVIWLYLRLLFVPYGQALDYDFPIVADIWQLKNWIAFAGLALLLAVAAFLRRRQPVISAGIFWFFLALSVESSVIPLDPVFEHRLYIPIFGFALVAMAAMGRLPQRGMVAGVVLVSCVLAVLTWQRNALWKDPFAFYQDNLRRAPRSERVHMDLGNIYMTRGRAAEAQALYERALEINPRYALVHINLSRAYADQKQYQKAVDILLEGLRLDPYHYKLYNNIGVLYNMLGQFQLASHYLGKGAAIEPDDPTVHFNLGLAYDRLGAVEQAIASYRRSIQLDKAEPMTHFNLGLALYNKGDAEGALQEFLITAKLNPRHSGTLYNAAMIYLNLGQVEAARNLAARLQQIDPDSFRKLQVKVASQGG